VPDRIWDSHEELRAEADAHRTRYRQANGRDDGWRELEVIRFADMQPRLDGRPLVKGFLEQQQISLWVGQTGCGKTFLVLDLALRIAAALYWFGRKVEPGFVVYVAAEAGRSIVNRVAAFKRAHGLEDKDIPFVAVTSPIDLCNPAAGDVERLIEVISEAAQGEQVVLVVIDTVSRALAGGNENAPDDMGAFVRSMDRLREELGCHVAAVHHFGKEAAKGSRGHSLLRCGVDTEIEISRDTATGIATATITKQRDGPADNEIAFQLRQIDLGKNEDGDPVTSCVVNPIVTSPLKGRAKPKLPPAPKRALELLTDAIAREGSVPAANNHIPSNTSCVTENLWRDYCYQGAISGSDKADAKQKAFKRAAKALLAAGRIGKWGDLIWVVP
jgi:KaiC/GvpD/RAD55 family RecA-like ATPase